MAPVMRALPALLVALWVSPGTAAAGGCEEYGPDIVPRDGETDVPLDTIITWRDESASGKPPLSVARLDTGAGVALERLATRGPVHLYRAAAPLPADTLIRTSDGRTFRTGTAVDVAPTGGWRLDSSVADLEESMYDCPEFPLFRAFLSPPTPQTPPAEFFGFVGEVDRAGALTSPRASPFLYRSIGKEGRAEDGIVFVMMGNLQVKAGSSITLVPASLSGRLGEPLPPVVFTPRGCACAVGAGDGAAPALAWPAAAALALALARRRR